MKKLIFYLLVVVLSALAVSAQDISTKHLYWFFPGSTEPIDNPISNCGPPTKVNFQARYNYGTCPVVWGNDGYRFEVRLYKDGVQIGYQIFQRSVCNFSTMFLNINAVPGNYTATIKFDKRTFPFTKWINIENGIQTNTIVAFNKPALPDFDINGDGESPVTVNIKQTIKLNAAATACESYYFIGIAERGYPSWTRTYDYEIGRWFGGQAPDGINLQLLAVTYSYPPDFLNGSMSRWGTPLFGGNVPSGEERWYDVAVCTDVPSWLCKNLQLRVEGP